MAVASYFDKITTEADFGKLFSKAEAKHLSELSTVDTASSWSVDNLFACRVIRKLSQKRSILPAVAPYVSDLRDSDDIRWSQDIRAFIDGPNHKQFRQSEHELIRRHGISLGQIWAALGAFYDHDHDLVQDEVSSEQEQRSNAQGSRVSRREEQVYRRYEDPQGEKANKRHRRWRPLPKGAQKRREMGLYFSTT